MNLISNSIFSLFDQIDLSKDNRDAISGNVFGRENLSDCGMQPKILEDLCRISPDSVRTLERMCFDKKQGGYTWA